MYFKVILLIPVLWMSISKIDKTKFYLNYIKKLETLYQKNSSIYSQSPIQNSLQSVSYVSKQTTQNPFQYTKNLISKIFISTKLATYRFILPSEKKLNKYWANAPPSAQ